MINMIEVLKPIKKQSELSLLIDEYQKKYGTDYDTESFYFSDEELTQIFKRCLKENKTYFEIIGEEPYDPIKHADEDW